MTEKEANQTWCPATRIFMVGSIKNEDGSLTVLLMNNRGECNFENTEQGIVQKEINCTCIGSRCQKWIWAFIESSEIKNSKPCNSKGFCEEVKSGDLDNIEKCTEFLKCLSIFQAYGEQADLEDIDKSQGFCTLGLPG